MLDFSEASENINQSYAENFSCLSNKNTKIDKGGDLQVFGIPFINQLEPKPPNQRSSL